MVSLFHITENLYRLFGSSNSILNWEDETDVGNWDLGIQMINSEYVRVARKFHWNRLTGNSLSLFEFAPDKLSCTSYIL